MSITDAILDYIEEHGSPTLKEIQEACASVGTPEQIRDQVRYLCQSNIIRQKEDVVEHEWVYRRNSSTPLSDALMQAGCL